MEKTIGLYIHVPFCRSKCAYCDFYSVTDNDDYQRYVDSLILHMEDYAPGVRDCTVDTVYIGGGTPSILPKKVMLDLINGIYKNFRVLKEAEFTIEVNPATATQSMFNAYHAIGINRLSIGMQSSCDNELRALTRIHDFEDFEECYKSARRAKFDNINLDIMYGIPEQTEASLRMTLEAACALSPEHISLYGLKIEENTPFAYGRDSLSLPDEDTEYNMYANSVEYLASQGYHQYEISNFSREGYQCRHNLKYWFCREYLGLGPGAHSYLNGCRFSFKRDLGLYMDAMERYNSEYELTDEKYDISPKDRIGEYVMLQLRLTRGLDVNKFYELFGIDFERMYARYLPVYVENGFMEKSENFYRFTLKGMYVSNYILSAMLDFDSEILDNIARGTDK